MMKCFYETTTPYPPFAIVLQGGDPDPDPNNDPDNPPTTKSDRPGTKDGSLPPALKKPKVH